MALRLKGKGLARKRKPLEWPFQCFDLGRTNRDMLCAGNVVERELLLPFRSASRVMRFEEVKCQTWATSVPMKLLMAKLTGVTALVLLMAMTVKAPSWVRSAANTAKLSGFVPPAKTLTSPKPDF